MPVRNTVDITLPPEMPLRCMDCPLLGIIPPAQRKFRSQKTYVCLGTGAALSQRYILSVASKKGAKHFLHKPCEKDWLPWMLLPGRVKHISKEYYALYRVPFQERKQMVIDFNWEQRR